MNLEINIQQQEKKQIVYAMGEIDIYTATELREAIIPLTVEKGMLVMVDLSKVTYIDSTGLGVFITAYKACQQKGSMLKLVGLPEKIERLFRITGLSEIINIETKTRGEKN